MKRKGLWIALILLILAAAGFFLVHRGIVRPAVWAGRLFGLRSNQLMRVEDQICSSGEANVFLTSQQAMYEAAYGNEIWDASFPDGATFASHMKSSLKEFLARLQAMQVMAKRQKISLTREEKALCEAAAREYRSRLSAAQQKASGMTEESVRQAFEKYCLANKLCVRLTAGESGVVSDSEARIIHVLMICASDRARVQEAYERVTAGADFETTAKKYTVDAARMRLTLARGDLPETLEQAAFALTDGQVSPVTEDGGMYYIFLCTEDYDTAATQANKERILQKRRAALFLEAYGEACEDLDGEFNEDAWDGFSLISDAAEYPDFYEVYRTYFP